MIDLFLNVAPAVQAIFKLGFKPKEEEFYELTEEQYEKFKEQGQEITCKWYLLLPKKYSVQGNEVITVNEKQKESLLKAAIKIEKYCEGDEKSFENYEEKLYYAASRMPEGFSEGTKFAKTRLKIIK